MAWAGVLALGLAVLSYLVGDIPWQTLLSGLTEIGIVVALFALVCATEAFN